MPFNSPSFDGHESVSSYFDRQSGLTCIVAIHSTVRGPGAGGCRMLPYANWDAALDDALRLSRAMSLKTAIAGLDLGGAWSVIIGDSRSHKTPALFEAYGRVVDTFDGRFWAIVDVGTTALDLVHARKHSAYVTGLDGHPAASGDPSPVTAESVFRSIKIAVKKSYGSSLSGVGVAVQGVGQVGASLTKKLMAAGARPVIADTCGITIRRVADETGARVVAPEDILGQNVEVFCPCALSGAISAANLDQLRARVVAGGANNQLADEDLGKALLERGVFYAPDYVANAGGIIHIAGEIRAIHAGSQFDPDWVHSKIDQLTVTLEDIFEQSFAERRPTNEIADAIAKKRLARV
ncbi:MAG: Glu/Leu/Phe/Val dehydrogenase dimerization domain-containing protein [Rhizomicrobium sp.]